MHKIKMSKILLSISALTLFLLSSCQETMVERAQREAYEYTRKYCPTPPVNYVITDSVAFNVSKETYIYYCTFTDRLDDEQVIHDNKQVIEDALRKSILESTNMKPFVEAGFHFRYICRSQKNPDNIILEVKFP